MSYLTEHPGLFSATGFFFLICLIGLFFYSRSKHLLPLMAAALALMIIPLVIDRLVETDQEQLKRRIYEMARCVSYNDVNGLLKYVHPEAIWTISQIESEMPTFKFSSCNVAQFNNISIAEDQSEAQVTILVFVNVHAPNYNDHHGLANRRVRLDFKRGDDDQWKVTGLDYGEGLQSNFARR